MFDPRNLDQSEFTFNDPIVRSTVEEYIEVRDKFINSIRHSNDVKAIYQMGSIGVPGVSDLDLVIVFNDELKDSRASDYWIDRLGDHERYIFMHNPFVVDEATFQKLGFMFYAANLKLLVGDDVPQESLSSDSDYYVKLAILIDYGIELVHLLTRPLVTKFVYVRSMLPILNSIRYSVGLARDLGISVADSWDKFTDDVSRLRESWVEVRDHDKLLRLIIDGLNVLFGLFSRVDDLLRERLVGVPEGPSKDLRKVLGSFDAATIFAGEPECLYEHGITSNLGIRHVDLKLRGKRRIFAMTIGSVPLSFYYHLSSYGGGSGQYSEHIRRLLGGSADDSTFRDPTYQAVMTERVEVYDRYKKFIRRNKLYGGDLGFFGGQKFDRLNRISLRGGVNWSTWYVMAILNQMSFAARSSKLEKLLVGA